MKTRVLTLVICAILAAGLHAQLRNLNPDPNGDPWYVGELRPLTHADSVWLAELPRLETPQNYRPLLRNEVDNTVHPWFRPIFSQEGGSCGQASGVGYNYTYEIDWLRGLSADSDTTQYPTHYTWDFLNGGNGGGSWYWDGWNIIDAGGVCNVAEYGGHYAYGGDSRWMSGYDAYYAGMDNRLGEMMAIEVGTPEGLETLKGWMTDYLEGYETGGLANFACGVSGYGSDYVPTGTPYAGEKIVTYWDPSVNHAMTFGAFNDSIRYDFNNDGQFTNDVDTNADGVVDMRDWEIGALKVVNSWGDFWENDGFVWMPYRLLALPVEEGGIWNNIVHVIHARADYTPLLTLSATVTHESRRRIKLVAGVSTDTNATEPEFTMEFPYFHYQGGDLYMQGGYSNSDKTLELGLDVTPLLGHITAGQPARWFLELHESDPYNMAWGQLNAFSVYDHTGDEVVEWESAQSDIPLDNNDVTRIWADATVDYEPVNITTEELPLAEVGELFSQTLQAENGQPPYVWSLIRRYTVEDAGWTEPQTSGNEIEFNNYDDGYGVVPLDFSFPFYTGAYDSVLVCTDGSLVFNGEVISVRTLDNLMQTRAITPYGTDLQIFTDSGDEDMMRVTWRVSRFDDESYNAKFEVHLYPSGLIEFVYGVGNTNDDNWVAGISEGVGSNYTLMTQSGANPLPDATAESFTSDPMPLGVTLREDGLLSGIPTQADSTWHLTVQVIDFNRVADEQVLEFSTQTNETDNDAPSVTQSLRVWPNPFNPTTTVSFSLAQPGDVRVDVFNIRGQMVRTLAKERFEAGPHELVWNGRANSGAAAATGVYFVRLKCGEEVRTNKALLLK